MIASERRYHHDAAFHARVHATLAQLEQDSVPGVNPLLIADVLHAHDRAVSLMPPAASEGLRVLAR